MHTSILRGVARGLTAALLLLPAPGQAQSAPAWAPVLDSVVNAALATSRAPGATVAVVHNGRLVYARGYGLANVETRQPMTADMLLRVGSVTKMFTGATLASLVEAGKLDMNKPIAEYIPSLNGKRVGTVTTQQLMTHSAGWLDNAVAYGRMGEGALGEVMREVSDTMFFTDAGRTFSYANPSISMAGYVAEMAGKQ
ncbi:serine hydrolase domain-containing protein, partial [Gemmatimonas sp.]|uniref:serine hydrolase domain-containing protein n=1 Tax=Gemmatimonas sp. TaxID=1962908 RepID=UPI00391F66EF